MHFVTDVEYLSDYKLHITFGNGDVKEVDLEPYLEGEIFEHLRNKEYFRQVRLDVDTICWQNGADLAPEFLHKIGRD